MTQETIERVRQIVNPILSSEGMELVDLEYRRESRGWVLRLYVDKEGGVTLEDCSRISRDVGKSLDVEDFIANPYTLEVSSPGLNRPLKSEKDFVRYFDRLITVKTVVPVGQRHRFKGRLLGVSEGRIEMEVDGKTIAIPLSYIEKANLEIEF